MFMSSLKDDQERPQSAEKFNYGAFTASKYMEPNPREIHVVAMSFHVDLSYSLVFKYFLLVK